MGIALIAGGAVLFVWGTSRAGTPVAAITGAVFMVLGVATAAMESVVGAMPL